jgi:hypothetical protein
MAINRRLRDMHFRQHKYAHADAWTRLVCILEVLGPAIPLSQHSLKGMQAYA